MRAVLISIQPKWCHIIASGEKTIEVRKTKPKLETPFKVYIYCTKDEPMYRSGERFWCGDDFGNGKVIGEFVCDTFITDRTFGHDALFRAAACMSDVDAAVYCVKKEMYGWHISDFKLYDEPKELSEFSHTQEYVNSVRKQVSHWEYGIDDEIAREIRRPPQSWMYVEEVRR